MAGFLLRLVGYALLLELSSRFAQQLWTQYGLGAVAALQPLHDNGILALWIAPFVLAIIGFGQLRTTAIFIGFALAAAALTAPFALARFALASVRGAARPPVRVGSKVREGRLAGARSLGRCAAGNGRRASAYGTSWPAICIRPSS